jgi:hypothetical protein
MLLRILATISVVIATSGAWAAPNCTALDDQVDSWQAFLESYGSPAILNAAGILAYGDIVTNGNDRLLGARHKTDVSTIFVKNLSGDFIRVVTSVPDGVDGSHQPALGTTLTRNGAAWNALTGINGNPPAEFCGTVSLFGLNVDSVYRPIESNGEVIGALFVGNETP